jgi:hypothetical protein
MGERRGAYRILAVKCVGKRQLGRPRRRWEENIKLIFGKWNGDTYTGFIRFRIGQILGSCDWSNEPSGPTMYRVLLD